MGNKVETSPILERRKSGNTKKEICEQLGITVNQYRTLLDKEYLAQIKYLQKSNMSDKDIYELLEIDKEKHNKLLEKYSSENKKNIKKNIYRNDPKYLRIDNYKDFELDRGIIVEAITRIEDSEELFQIKKISTLRFIQKDIHPMVDIQSIKDAISYDKERIKQKIKTISNSPEHTTNKDLIERLKDNDWAIRTVKRIFELEETLLVNIFKRLSIEDSSPFFVKNYNLCDFNELHKDYIDILDEEIDRKYQYSDNRLKRKNRNNKVKNRRTKLVKYYLLKYIQTPLPRYGIDYSNSLLDEYGFQKVSLELDMTISKKDQKKLIKKTIEELYSKKLSFNYSEFILRSLLKDDKDPKYKKVHTGTLAPRHSSLSERVSDLFYIYDLRVNNVTYESCTELLTNFYENKNGHDVQQSSVHFLAGVITKFMKEFQEVYKIQPSKLIMSLLDSEKNKK